MIQMHYYLEISYLINSVVYNSPPKSVITRKNTGTLRPSSIGDR
ncbi:hypothetical protein MTBBW1_1470018 [Desulfamplus magnetovallimortis]|uniref:Uncharacterized protein n=1 Tax=Desulfamplus magnetovallimortis TaxID=1246637 RepID=A0A1W1H8J0_9BACT|nr:hypothetical protein MTBBW1_1470018 [Desulfamplus magnetovallimortis]